MLGIDSISSEWMVVFGVASAITFVLSLIIVPVVIIRIPENYFSSSKPDTIKREGLNPVTRLILTLIKNVSGLILLIMGVLMLVLPGQGLLTMLFGIALLDFPGKQKLLRCMVSYPKMLNSINWIRKKANKNPLLVD